MPHSKFMMRFKKSQKSFLSGLLIVSLSIIAPLSMAETYQVVYHVVEANETLSGLSKQFNISVAAIQKANGKDDVNLAVGERLLIPINKLIIDSEASTEKVTRAKTSKQRITTKAQSTKKTGIPSSKTTKTQKYRVQSGDNLGAIALKYNTTVADITKANNITEAYILMIDDLLLIPTSSSSDKTVKKDTNSKNKATSTKKVSVKKVDTYSNDVASLDIPLVYEVVSGDVLGAIVDKYKLNLADIIELNSLENVDSLSVGQKLTLRKKKEVRPSRDYTKIANSSTY